VSLSQYVLAVHAGHNAGAAIGDAAGLRLAIQEERLTGEKNYWGYPRRAIDFCLRHVDAAPDDLAVLAVGGKQVLSRYRGRDEVLHAYRRQSSVLGRMRQRIAMPMMLALRPNFGQDRLERQIAEHGLSAVPRRHHDHHRTHAATAYFGLRQSPAERYVVLTCDGDGDGACATVRTWGAGEERLVATTPWDNSLGALYSWITYLLGFMPLEHEYKLMGMAPYASESGTEELATVFRRYLALDDTGLAFRRKTRRRMNDLCDRLHEDLRGRRFDYICAGLQRLTEEILAAWAEHAVRATGIRKVLAAGGVFMNVKANKRIAELADVDSFEAFPSCGDETLPLGVYYLEAAERYGADQVRPLDDFYLGDEPSDDDATTAVRNSGFRYSRPENIAAEVAGVLAAGHPVARCAGRMEFGARALGNRSILADPHNQDVVRVINQMVKKRDFWMPFAPMVLAERQHEYIQNPKSLRSPFMMMTFDTRENFRDMIAAVHNADLTCRAQILEPAQNRPMYEIVKAFEALSGRGVVLNTSFNLHGFPIVRTADDALHVFKNSGLTHLQVGPYLVSKG
jgi:carbamoyltransferase